MKINEAGINLIKEFEGCRLTAYKDIRGVLTTGWGHTGGYVHEGMQITQEEALELLMQDLEGYELDVTRAIKLPVSDNQFSAMVALCYNIGPGNFRTSTLVKLVNKGNFKDAAVQFLRWDKVKGVSVPGLLRRRTAEMSLFASI